MSDTTNNYDNIYHADYLGHSRKGKKMDKHKKASGVKRIMKYKAKNNLGSETWVSSWDVYKATTDKLRTHSKAKSDRAKGHDYKVFIQTNEIPCNNTDEDEEFWDYEYNWDCQDDWLDNYSDYSDCRSYSDYYDDDWDLWDWNDDRSVGTHRTNRTLRSGM
jgi:hypothetical protein